LIKANWLLISLLAALLGLGLGETGWAIALQHPDFFWPADWNRAEFYLAGMGTALIFAFGQAWFWGFAFSFQWITGLRIAAFSLFCALAGFAWPIWIRVVLPSPHDFPLRNLEILLAAQCLGCLWVSLGIGVALIAWSREFRESGTRSLAWRLGALAFLVYFLSGFWVGQWNNTGDAPHYIMISDSLAYDHDVDLANNFRNGDWRNFYDRDLAPQDPPQADGRQISEHKPGLPLVIAPGYYFLGFSGVRWILALLAAAGSGVFFLLCLRLGLSRTQALWGWLIFSFSAPWLCQSQIALSELPGGLMLLCVLAAWRGALPRMAAPLACAALAWLNVRFFPVAAFLALIDAVELRREGRGWIRALLPLLVTGASLGLALYYNLLEFGHLSPAQAYAQKQMSIGTMIQPLMIFRYASGLMIDQEYGWLPYAPIYALAFFGLWALWRRDRPLFWMSLLPSLLYLGPVACFPWWPSAMAPNRYVVFLTPVFALWTLEAWRAWGSRPGFVALAALAFFWGFFLTVLPWFCFGKLNGQNMVLGILGKALHHPLTPWFPTFWMDDPKSYFWVLGLLILGGLYAKKLCLPKA
jgi:hypothetical protein